MLKQEMALIAVALRDAYRRDLTPGEIDSYYQYVFSPEYVTAEVAEETVRQWILNNPRLPTVAELRSLRRSVERRFEEHKALPEPNHYELGLERLQRIREEHNL